MDPISNDAASYDLIKMQQ